MQNNPPSGPNEPTYTPQPYPPYPQPPRYYSAPPPPRPGQFGPPPYQPPPPPKRKRRTWLWIVVGIIALIVFYQIGQATFSQSTTNTALTATQAPATGNTPAATPTPQPIHYPPTTVADLHGLAAKGDVSAIHEFHSESVGLVGVCPQPKREVTVDPSVTGKQLAEDLLAYFYGQQLDSPCGSIVFAYHNQGEANGVYTAGRIVFDVTDSSGAANVDPNATNLTYTLTLDVGGDFTGKEYVVKY